jgi:signal transduction histidine kinase
MKGLREWWGRLSLQARLAGAFALLAAAALIFLLAIIARTLGMETLAQGKILPAALFALTIFFLGGWLVAGWCLREISLLGSRINETPQRPLPVELEGLAALLRREAQKRDSLLRELRRFTADASHELRTPLTALRTVGEVALMNETATAAEWRDALGSMLEEAQRMNALVERLLRLARVESEGMPVHLHSQVLHDLMHDWRDSLNALAEDRSVTLRVQCPAKLTLVTDADLLGQAMTNLALNALQHSPSGAEVELAAEVLNDEIVLTVRDQGEGIEAEHLPRLFERFYRIDPARSRKDGGFGLGLCIAHTAITRLQGRLKVESTAGQGTVFQIQLPIIQQIHRSTPGTLILK